MKDGVRIINVSRGPLINELDLVQAINNGKVDSVALDVFEVEPMTVDNPLKMFDRSILGTHNGSNTIEGVRRASLHAIELLFKFLKIK